MDSGRLARRLRRAFSKHVLRQAPSHQSSDVMVTLLASNKFVPVKVLEPSGILRSRSRQCPASIGKHIRGDSHHEFTTDKTPGNDSSVAGNMGNFAIEPHKEPEFYMKCQ